MAVDVSMWSSESWSSAADMYLLARTREGSDEAFAELWRRHLPAAYAVAHRYQANGHAEDVVAEAATRVLALLKEGRGPEENFRSYFLTAVRSVAVDAGRRDLKLVPTPVEELDELTDAVVEPHDDEFDPELIREAFRRLPERDQRVLWHTTVEGEAPRVVGPAIGMSANAVSVRAMRAREALRVRYLQTHAAQHLAAAESAECKWAIGVLADHVRGHLPKRASDRLKEHLAGCEHDRAVQAQLRSLHDRFPALIVPLVFLAGASTPGFLGGALFAGAAGAGVAGSELAGAELAGSGPVGAVPAEVDAAASGAAGGLSEPATGAQGVPAAEATGLAGKVAAAVAGVVIAAGVLGAASSTVGRVAAGPATPSSSSVTSATPTSAAPMTSTSATPSITTTVAPPTTSAPTTTASPVARSSAVRVTAAPSPVPRPAPPSGSHTVELRIISPGTPTRFSLRFDSAIGGTLRVTVSNSSGTGRLTAENGAFTCTNTSRSSVRCSGRTGQLMLSQSGLSRPQPVVVRVTDSTGATSTRTFSLR